MTAIILGVLTAVGFVVVPPVLTSVSTSVADTDTTVRVPDDNGAVSVAVPAEWVVQRPFLQRDTLLLNSPDGALQLEITARATSAADTFTALTADQEGLGAPVTETLRSGLSARHAQTDDARVVVAAVGAEGAAASAGVVARVADADPAAYRPALAQVLDGIGVVT